MKVRMGIIVGVALLSASCGDGITNPNVAASSEVCSIVITGSGNNAACRDTSVVQPGPSPSPTPLNSGDCRVDYLRSSGPEFLANGSEATFGITPMQSFVDSTGATQAREVSASCNESRPEPDWDTADARVLTVAPFGTRFEAKVKRVGTGPGRITVEFEGRKKEWSVQ